jgi:hypothetical protein
MELEVTSHRRLEMLIYISRNNAVFRPPFLNRWIATPKVLRGGGGVSGGSCCSLESAKCLPKNYKMKVNTFKNGTILMHKHN